MRRAAATTLALGALLLAAGGCHWHRRNDRVERQIAAQLRAGRGWVDLAPIGPEGWDRLCIVGPYASREANRTQLQADWDVNEYSGIETDVGIQLLVFLKGPAVMTYSEHPRTQGDLVQAEGQCLPRSHATLRRDVAPDGRVMLVPNPGSPP